MEINEEKALEIGRRVLAAESMALETMKNGMGQAFVGILREMGRCRGKVIVTGMGKSGHVAAKMAATMASLGTSAFFLNPAEAMHGDLGMVGREDLVIAISYSGESEEIIRIVPNIHMIGARIAGITGNAQSTLARGSDIVQCLPGMKEACHLGLAPTTSTTAVMAYGDALAVALAELGGFTRKQFGLYHPAGSLGKKLTMRVTDLMDPISEKDCVREDALLREAVIRLGRMGTDLLPILSVNGMLSGVVTDGDIERALRRKADIYRETVASLANPLPVYVEADTMAYDARSVMERHGIRSLPVVREERVIGIVAGEKIQKAGICL